MTNMRPKITERQKKKNIYYRFRITLRKELEKKVESLIEDRKGNIKMTLIDLQKRNPGKDEKSLPKLDVIRKSINPSTIDGETH